MKRWGLRSIVSLSLAMICAMTAWAGEVPDPELRSELLLRSSIDQFLRFDLDMTSDKVDVVKWSRIRVIDRGNTRWMRQVVARYGWPSRTVVGEDGAAAAWLLVQHADLDPAFQRDCLRRMEKLGNNEVEGESLALLTDRVRLADGQHQVYGSQVEGDCTKGFHVRSLADPAHVDERRAARGLPPLTAYLEQIHSIFCSRPSKS